MIQFLREFWRFARERKKLWLLPIFLILLLIGGIMTLSAGSAWAPFLYSLF
jgi:hypothetical protein